MLDLREATPESESASPSLLTERIRDAALALGFDFVGFAPAEPSEHAVFLDEWLAEGMAGEMTYLARNAEARKDPHLALPGAESVVCVAMSYSREPPPSFPPDSTPHGRVARYAWGDDYHEVMRDLLERLKGEIEALSGSKAYVDTGPLLEREIAERAGLGWTGKHTLLIRRGAGSWLLLGEIVTTARLEYGTPPRNLCGSCTRCIDACPTGAIVEPYKLDARKCISYLTIELKGSIPEEARLLLGDWIFGCDVCQEVCPWNRKAPISPNDPFHARGEEIRAPDLIELLRMDDAAFRERFRKSPIKRAKRRGVLRNAAVALGNSGDARGIPALIEALSDAESLVREHAAWALGRLGGEDAKAALETALVSETDRVVAEAIRRALERL